MLILAHLSQGPEVDKAEVVCQRYITSGGGFSVFYSQPAYQRADVSAYFIEANKSTAPQPVAGYSVTGRGYPDISFVGISYRVQLPSEYDSVNSLVAGTSTSCPVAAGIFSNVNAARLAAGKGSIGWANPALYKYASSFIRDVTSGNNTVGVCSVGFYATPGWDPTTGLGSIDYGKFESLMLSLGTVNAQTWAPTATPTGSPKGSPVPKPTLSPIKTPTIKPFRSPSRTPSLAPSDGLPPSIVASASPTATEAPVPADYPSSMPSTHPPDSSPSLPSQPQSTVSNYPSLKPTIYPPFTRADTLTPTAGSVAILRGFQVTNNI